MNIYCIYFTIKLLQQHVGHLVSTTNAEDHTVHASNETWTGINIDKSQTCLGAAILMGKHVLPEAENYWSSYLCSQSSITAQVMTCQHFKKLTETIHINNNDRVPMLVNGMNKWQISLIVYFNHYIIFQEII